MNLIFYKKIVKSIDIKKLKKTHKEREERKKHEKKASNFVDRHNGADHGKRLW